MPGCSGGHTGLGKARLEAVSKLSAVAPGVIFVQFKARGAWLTRTQRDRG
jgi:hypothetical protein